MKLDKKKGEPPTAPQVDTMWEDARGRVLTVREVDAGDRLGREVRGVCQAPDGGGGGEYSCTLVAWGHIWRDKQPDWAGEEKVFVR